MDYRDKTKDQLIEELKNCQALLESQHQELQQIALRLEKTSAGHPDVFDFSPIGYFSLDTQGMILRANPASALVLGSDTDRIVNLPFCRFVLQEDHKIFDFFSQKAQQGHSKQSCNIRLVKEDGTELYAQLEGIAYFDELERREKLLIAVIDYTQNKHMEDRINSVKEQWERIFDAMPDLVSILDTEHEIVWLNRAMAARLGMTRQDAIGSKCDQAVHGANEPPAFCPHAKAMQDGRQHDYEVTEPRLGGVFDVSVCPLFDTENKLIGSIHIAREVSTHKKMEAELAQSEHLYRTFFESSRDCVGITTLDGQILDINKAGIQMLGYGPDEKDEILQTNVVNFYANQQEREDHAWGVTEKGFLHDVPVQFSKKDGSVIDTLVTTVSRKDEHGAVIGFYGVVRDTTDQRRYEEALRKNEEMFRTILSTTPVGIGLAEDRTMKWVNDAWLQMFGYDDEQECIGRNSAMFYSSPEEYKRMGKELYQDLETGKIAGVYAKGRKKNGSLFDAHVRLKLLNPNQPGGAAIAVVTDVSERKKAEAQLKESQQRLEFALKGADLGWWDLDLKTGRVTIDERIAGMFGYGLREIEATLDAWQESIHPDDRPKVEESFRRSLENRQDFFELEYRVQTKSGSYMWIMSRGSTMERDNEGRPLRISGTFMDITSRKELEDKLKESEHRYQALFENMLEGFAYCKMLYDDQGRPVDWVYLTVNQAFYELTGLKDVVGRTVTEAIPGIRESNPELFETYGRVASTGHPETFEIYLETLEIYFHVSVTSPEKGYVVVVFENVTDRVKAQETQVRLTTAIEQASEGIVILDTHGTIEYVNSGYETITGYSKEELVGTQHYFFQTDGGYDSLGFDFQQAVMEGLNWSGTISRIRKDGEPYSEEVLLSPVRSGNGEITNYVLTKRDITKELDLRRQLLQAQKMEAVGTLAGGIAHDFNNILQVVLGYSELLLAGKEKTDKDFAELDKINSASKRGADLVQNLMMFSRKVEPNLKPLDLNDEVAQIQKLLSRTIPKNINITVHLSGDLSLVEADVSQMGQVLMNLAVNSRDAMQDGGKLNFETSNVELDEEFCLRHPGSHPGTYVLLTVSDTGTGMTKETVSHIFEPFFTTKGVGHGTGLGLATVYGIVKQHRGYITCESEVGTGTTFKVYLPAIDKECENDSQECKAPLVGGTETILLVDDEEHLRDLGATILQRYGYEVITAENGTEAFGTYRKDQEKISLVILDLIMPEMDGKKCLAEILKVNPDAKVLIASGYSETSPSQPRLLPGAKGLVTKPYEMRKLLHTVREVLDSEG